MIGSFVSMSNGDINNSIKLAKEINADCCMVYTQAPQFPKKEEKQFVEREECYKDFEVITHAAYTINLGTDKKELSEFTKDILYYECLNASKIKSNYLVVHPGSAIGRIRDCALSDVSSRLNDILKRTSEFNTTILIETMAGKGTELCRDLLEVKDIISKIDCKERIGICLDTCHLHDSGYIICLSLADKIMDLGLEKYVKCVHVNGSLNTLGSRKDRHSPLLSEDNKISLEGLKDFVNYYSEKNIPCILETPAVKELNIKKCKDQIKEEIECLKGRGFKEQLSLI